LRIQILIFLYMGKLINISEAASLAIHCLALMAASKEPLNATRMAFRLGASRNHIAKVLQQLVKQGYISSIRGPKGGFNVKADTGNISLLEIYEVIEGSSDIEYCNVHSVNCPFSDCVFGDIRERLNEEFRNYFKKRKIGDIVHLK
jgi:Rrf2 family protein